MEQYYYNHMNKQEQAAYHGILQGISGLADEFQIPALDGETLYNVFFSSAWTIRRFSGQRDINTDITKNHRILFLFRNICLIKAK